MAVYSDRGVEIGDIWTIPIRRWVEEAARWFCRAAEGGGPYSVAWVDIAFPETAWSVGADVLIGPEGAGEGFSVFR